MKMLMVGHGGREHSTVLKLAQSRTVTELSCTGNNPGIKSTRLSSNGSFVTCIPYQPTNVDGLANFAESSRIDLTFVGPEKPLALGMVDRFQEKGLKIVGPTLRSARFETDKALAQKFWMEHGIPSPDGDWFSNVSRAIDYAKIWKGECAVKASGLAEGKGVDICLTMEEAEAAIKAHLVGFRCKEASSQIVIQQLLKGREVSIIVLTDGKTYRILPPAQDYKRLGKLNTGGMGTYSPSPLSEEELRRIENEIIIPWMKACRKKGIAYQGVMYFGIMLTDKGPKLLEMNCRFGDPETQVQLLRIKNDLFPLLLACAEGNLEKHEIEVSDEAAVCVILASEGYPENPIKGRKISGLEEAAQVEGVKIIHAGTVERDGELFTDGGRVVGVTALLPNLAKAREAAYKAANLIRFEGKQMIDNIALIE